jgi:hypothetical protein
MADQPPIRDVVLRCRDCFVEVKVTAVHQECQSFHCAFTTRITGERKWSGWEIAHITRAEAA